ncbi:curli assembly protein CsgF [Microvirga sp. TS319]|uniref:curli assembly protein CsgF n=1 Tax=Microvirga sp. TS319 TaxID=3241165 RepID=UPI00351A25F1
MRNFGFYAIAIGGVLASSGAFASEMIYRPQNPNFGGNPLNGTLLMQQAQAQGKGAKGQEQQIPEINFPDLGGVGNTPPIIIIGGSGQPTIPANP